jgi:hypothetical protein
LVDKKGAFRSWNAPGEKGDSSGLFAVAADGFDGATAEGFFAELQLFVGLRLLVDVGVTAVIVTGEVGGSGFAAKIAVDALIVHVKGARDVLGVFVCCVSHVRDGVWRDLEGKNSSQQGGFNRFFPSLLRGSRKVAKVLG